MEYLHTVPSLGIGGGGPPRSVSQLCNAMCQSEGHEISILTARYPHDPLVELNGGIELTTLQAKGHSFLDRLGNTGFGDTLSSIAEVKSLSLIHQHGIWLRSSREVIHAASKLSLPCVVAPRGMLEPWALNNNKWKKKLAWTLYQKRDLQKVTAFHATAQSEAESIRRLGFKQPTAVIPNGIVLPEISKMGDRRWQMEKGECDDPPSIINHQSSTRTALFLSRINPKKGLPILLDAWHQVAPADWRLVIAGNDDSNHLPEVERKIRELGLQDQVEIAGPLFGEAKEAAYRNADLFVLPSYSENFGIVVAEALSYGVPVLTTTGCPWQELETYNCGWWVQPTLDGVFCGLGEALGMDVKSLKLMGARGRRLVENNYQWPGIAEAMLEFYDWLLNGGTQPKFVL